MENSVVNIGRIGLFFGVGAVPITLILIALFVRWRTGSFLTVFSRMWAFFHGKNTATVPFIKEYLEAQSSVIQMVFSTGAKVRTEQHARRLIDWSAQNDESLIDAVRCGRYFDWELPGLKTPVPQAERREKIAMFFIFLSLSIFISALCAVMSYERPLLQFKASSTFFSMTADYARPAWSDLQLEFSRCADIPAGKLNDHGFTNTEARQLCDSFGAGTQEEREKYVNQSLRDQRAAAGSLAALCFALLYIPISVMIMMEKVTAMRRRLSNKSSGDLNQNTEDAAA